METAQQDKAQHFDVTLRDLETSCEGLSKTLTSVPPECKGDTPLGRTGGEFARADHRSNARAASLSQDRRQMTLHQFIVAEKGTRT